MIYEAIAYALHFITGLYGNRSYVLNFDLMPDCRSVCASIVRSSYGTHLLDHLAADRTGLAGGQVAVVALLQVDADFLGCPHSILN